MEDQNSENSISWLTSLSRSLEVNQSDPHHRFVQLATVTKQGEPRNRTLVYRGLDEEGAIWLCTDRRSSKVDELSEGAPVELCWYFLRSREQYRLRGCVDVISDEALRERVWARLSLSTRAQFHWPKPGERLRPEDVLDVDQIDLESLRDAPISQNFLLFRVVAGYVDYLSLGERHRRWISVKSRQGWGCAEVTP